MNLDPSQRLIATPAIRTLKISVFYPKNSQKSQTLLRLGSRYTSDDSPTVTQIYLQCTILLFLFCVKHKIETREQYGGWWRFSATPATRTFKNMRFYLKFIKKDDFSEVLRNLKKFTRCPKFKNPKICGVLQTLQFSRKSRTTFSEIPGNYGKHNIQKCKNIRVSRNS